MADTPPEEEAPLIDLTAVRTQRQEARARAAQAKEQAYRNAWQDQALHEALLKKRMTFADLADMLRLGIISDEDESLPCQDREEPADYYKWVRQTRNLYLEGEQEKDARPRYPDEPEWSIAARQRPRPRHTVECPLMAMAVIPQESPPCIEALRRQAADPWLYDTETHQRVQKTLDPEDLVVKYETRPCAVLGRRLIRAVMLPVWNERPTPSSD